MRRISRGGKIPPVMVESTFLQNELRRRMKDRGLSARALSLKAVRPDGSPVNETAVKAILSGKSRNPRMDTVQALADVFGCKTDDLLGPRREIPTAEPESAARREQTIGVLKDLLRAQGADPDEGRARPRPRKRGARKSSNFAPKTRRSRSVR